MSDLIDVNETLELLERAVAERGEDFLYPTKHVDDGAWRGNGTSNSHSTACRYARADNRAPACIVGQVLAYRGLLDLERIREGVDAREQVVIMERFTPTAIDILAEAQGLQDTGATWGEALGGARRSAATLAEMTAP